jgi:hypothetical protein
MGKKNWSWAILGLLALALRFLASQFPETTDRVYSRSIFPFLRNLLDLSLGKLPFPSIYLFFILIGVILIIFIFRLKAQVGRKQKLHYSLRFLCNALGALIFFFLVLWGYNYQRTPIVQQLGLLPTTLSLEILETELELTRNLAFQERLKIKEDTAAINEWMDYALLEEVVRNNMRKNLFLLGINYTGNPRTKLVPPSGFMRRIGILGIYFPYSGESYIDPSLHPLEQPFTIAHEMAHSFGVTDEGEANFLAWVICSHADDPRLRYSAQLRLLLYQLRDYRRESPERMELWIKNLPPGLRQDLIAIQKANERYKPFFLEFSRWINDLFLKSQGIEAGITSYQELPMLVHAWRKDSKRNKE